MFQKLLSLHKSEMVKNSITLLSASTLSQVIAVIVYPIITRQYLPEELGVLALFLSIVAIVSDLASGKYELAIMVERKKENAAAAFDISFLINVTLCLLTLVLVILFKDWLVSTFQLESIASFLIYLPLLIFLSALGVVLTYWFNKNKRFALSARYNIVQSSVNSGLKVGFGSLGFTQWGLIAASIIGQIAGVLSVFFKKKGFEQLFTFDKKRIKKVAKEQVDFPKYTLPHSFVNRLAGNLIIPVLAAYFNMAEVGLFSLGITLGFKPISIFTGSVNQVFFQKASENSANGINSFKLLSDFSIKILLLTTPLFVVIYFILPTLVQWIFGANWIKSAEYLQLMLPWFLVSLVSSSICFMPALVGKQLKALVLEVIFTVVKISAIFIGVWIGNIKLAVFLFATANFIFVGGMIFWYLRLAKTQTS